MKIGLMVPEANGTAYAEDGEGITAWSFTAWPKSPVRMPRSRGLLGAMRGSLIGSVRLANL